VDVLLVVSVLVALAVQVAVKDGVLVVLGDVVGRLVAVFVWVGGAVKDGVPLPVPLGELVADAVAVREGVGCALMLDVTLAVCVPLPVSLVVTEGVGSPGVPDNVGVKEALPVPLPVEVPVGVEDAVNEPVPVTLNVAVPLGVDVTKAV
jgi:hypothetical protein